MGTPISHHRELTDGLSEEAADACARICETVSHLRSQKANRFRMSVRHHMERLAAHPLSGDIFPGAVRLSRLGWALVIPYLEAVARLEHRPEAIETWTRIAMELARLDLDVASAFLERTPDFLSNLGPGNLFDWGELARSALDRWGKPVWKPVRAYLEAAAENECAYPLKRWDFFLEQSAAIAERSTAAAAAFIRHGNRACLLLDANGVREWVARGIAASDTEEELLKYFIGTSSKAMEHRDGLVSGVPLKDKSNTLSLICEAALGRPVKIRSNISLARVKGFTGAAATDGRAVYLPDRLPDFDAYKLMALHQTFLMDCGALRTGGGLTARDPVALHVEADRRLAERLPGMRPKMAAQSPGELPRGYPFTDPRRVGDPLPWWGDFLPELVAETDAAIDSVKEKAVDYTDLPPEMIEALLAGLIVDGTRDESRLMALLREMFDHLEFSSPDPEELRENVKTFFYREWDKDLSDYKLEWCMVRQRLPDDAPNDFVKELKERLPGIIKLIRRQFMLLKPERFKKYKAQPAGDHLDIDALVAALVDRKSGSYLSENVYIWRDKRIRDVASLFLLDTSGSSEERVDGRRVIDIQKEAMALMAEALDSLGDPYAVFGFSTQGRFRVNLFQVKDFGEDYTERVQHRLGNLRPDGLTRMGAVIRHGIHKLESVSAAVRLMVILTDGMPYDLEYGNLDYAIADTRKAILEARRRRIHPFVITSDKKSEGYLRRISQETQSIILPKVELLPSLLPAVYKRLTV